MRKLKSMLMAVAVLGMMFASCTQVKYLPTPKELASKEVTVEKHDTLFVFKADTATTEH